MCSARSNTEKFLQSLLLSFLLDRFKMQVLSLCVLLSFISLASCSSNKTIQALKPYVTNQKLLRNQNSLASNAISSILMQYFGRHSEQIDVIYYGKKTGGTSHLLEETLKIKPEAVPIRVLDSSNVELVSSSLLLFDSPEVFKKKSKSISFASNTWASKTIRHKHLVHIANGSVNDIAQNIRDGFSIDSVSFLVNENEKSIDLVTSFMFTPQACRSNQLVTINRFFKNTMSWENSTFYPMKYQNIHGCTLTVSSPKGRSISTQIINTIGQRKNFKTRHETSSGSAKTDLIDALSSPSRLTSSYPFFFDHVKLTVPTGEPYSDLEKMFLFFDFETWVAIIVTILIGLVTIQVVNLCSTTVKKFVFGRDIQTPTLNLVSVFLNGGQIKTPGRNFARFLLWLFIVWSLIIRTCYQSELFIHMQADTRKPEIRSVEEMIMLRFTLYTTENMKGLNL